MPAALAAYLPQGGLGPQKVAAAPLPVSQSGQETPRFAPGKGGVLGPTPGLDASHSTDRLKTRCPRLSRMVAAATVGWPDRQSGSLIELRRASSPGNFSFPSSSCYARGARSRQLQASPAPVPAPGSSRQTTAARGCEGAHARVYLPETRVIYLCAPAVGRAAGRRACTCSRAQVCRALSAQPQACVPRAGVPLLAPARRCCLGAPEGRWRAQGCSTWQGWTILACRKTTSGARCAREAGLVSA